VVRNTAVRQVLCKVTLKLRPLVGTDDSGNTKDTNHSLLKPGANRLGISALNRTQNHELGKLVLAHNQLPLTPFHGKVRG